MSIHPINHLLALGNVTEAGQFPHLEPLKQSPFQFKNEETQ